MAPKGGVPPGARGAERTDAARAGEESGRGKGAGGGAPDAGAAAPPGGAAPGPTSGLTLGAFRRRLAARLTAAGLDAGDREARLILAYVLGVTPAALLAAAGEPLSEAVQRQAGAVAARRLAGEPMGRIMGHREFWSLDFRLSPDTLEPRPDTECVVEAALAAVPERDAPWRILDLGTGTGAILAALLAERPRAFGVAVDLAPGAAATARDNLARAGLAARAAVIVAHWGEALAGGFDLVVSNPPYIRSADLAGLSPEVRLHDPPLALDGGRDGLAAYRAIAADLPRLLAPGGAAVLELGAGQADAVAAVLEQAGLTPKGAPRRDLGGIDRALTARRPPAGR